VLPLPALEEPGQTISSMQQAMEQSKRKSTDSQKKCRSHGKQCGAGSISICFHSHLPGISTLLFLLIVFIDNFYQPVAMCRIATAANLSFC
jgi:hypothetical protein